MGVPRRWTIGAGQRLLVWADAQPEQTDGANLHGAFRLDSVGGTVVLAWQHEDRTLVLDALEYADVAADSSFGSYPEGDPHSRQAFHYPTPAQPNRAEWPSVPVTDQRVDGWQYASRYADPADGDFDDWFELHNAGTQRGGPRQLHPDRRLRQPDEVLDPGGHDHSRRRLPAGLGGRGERPKHGRTGFARQFQARAVRRTARPVRSRRIGSGQPFRLASRPNDISMGRFPDGAGLPLYEMAQPTPRGPNSLPGANRPPVFEPVPEQTVAENSLLTFTVKATDADPGETVRYSLGVDAPGEADAGPTDRRVPLDTRRSRWTGAPQFFHPRHGQWNTRGHGNGAGECAGDRGESAAHAPPDRRLHAARRRDAGCPGPGVRCRSATAKPELLLRRRRAARPVDRSRHRLDSLAGRPGPGREHQRRDRERHRRWPAAVSR